jgi:hypothetical protein
MEIFSNACRDGSMVSRHGVSTCIFHRSPIHKIMIAALLFCTATTQAQIVNVLDRVDELSAGFRGAVSLPLEWRTGNPDLLQIAGTLEVGYRTGDYLLMLIGNGELGREDGERFVANHFEHLRLRRQLSARIAGELFGQLAHDEFQRLTLRTLAGFAVRFTVARSDRGRFVMGTGYLAEYERISEQEDLPGSDETVYSDRWASYAELLLEAASNIATRITVYAQPVLNSFNDVRLLGDASLKLSAGAFFVENSLQVSYDSRAPTGVEELQSVLQSALGFEF